MLIKKDILVLGKGPAQGLEDTSTAEKRYSVNFALSRKLFCLSLHYNGANSYSFVNGKEIVEFKAKNSAILATPVCLGNPSKDWSTDNVKKTRLSWYVYEFNVDYESLSNLADAAESIRTLHKYFMGKYNIT